MRQNAKMQHPAGIDPCDLWEPIVSRLLGEVEDLEARGLAVYRRGKRLAVRKEVFCKVLQDIAPGAPPLDDVLLAWRRKKLVHGHPAESWTKAVMLRNGTVRRMIVIPMPEEE